MKKQGMMSFQHKIDVHNKKVKMKSKLSETDLQFYISDQLSLGLIYESTWVHTILGISYIHKSLDMAVGDIQVEKAEN